MRTFLRILALWILFLSGTQAWGLILFPDTGYQYDQPLFTEVALNHSYDAAANFTKTAESCSLFLQKPGNKIASALVDGSVAVNNATKPLLNRQLSAEQIAKCHAFEKHVLQQGQFPFIKTKKQFADHLENVMANPTHHRSLGGGREAFYDSRTSTFIVRNPNDPDGGSAFQESLDYFNRQN